jgi:hypothetical protein
MKSRKQRGRLPTGQEPVTAIRLSAGLRAKIDGWARKQPDAPARSEAIRRLVEHALAGSPSAQRSPAARSRATTLASKQLDQLIDPGAPEEERQRRKRRLLKGPDEFRELREKVRSRHKT